MSKYAFDFHTHSDFSDGDWPPEIVFEKAKQAGLSGIVLTDHNTINGANRARQSADKLGLFTLEGIEISCGYEKIDIHILGFAEKFNREILNAGIRQVVDGNNQRVSEMVDKINALKRFPHVDFQTILKKKGPGGAPMKYDILREIKRLRSDFVPAELIPLLKRGGEAYVPYGNWAMDPFRAIKLIKQAGGIAVFAHPGSVDRSDRDKTATKKIIDDLTGQLAHSGLDGIEAKYSKHTAEQEHEFLAAAEKYGLLVSGGSDWHGELHHPEIKMGDGGLAEEDVKKIKKALASTK